MTPVEQIRNLNPDGLSLYSASSVLASNKMTLSFFKTSSSASLGSLNLIFSFFISVFACLFTSCMEFQKGPSSTFFSFVQFLGLFSYPFHLNGFLWLLMKPVLSTQTFILDLFPVVHRTNMPNQVVRLVKASLRVCDDQNQIPHPLPTSVRGSCINLLL